MNHTPDDHDHIDGVTCDVLNCAYNQHSTLCHARSIEVGPQHAVSCADTVCATFKPETDTGTTNPDTDTAMPEPMFKW